MNSYPNSPAAPPPLSTPTDTTESPPTLRRATRADLPDIALCLAHAFLDFELYEHFLASRREHFEEYYRYLLMRIKGIWAEPNSRFYVAETYVRSEEAMASGNSEHRSSTAVRRIIGFAAWEADGATNPLAVEWRAERDTWSNAIERYLLPLEQKYTRYFLNRVADHVTLLHLRSLFSGNFKTVPFTLHLAFLVTHPSHRGIGAGGMLLEHGLREFARPHGLPVVLESSLAGWKFYEYKAFKVCKWVRISKAKGGWTKGEEYDMPVMIWEPDGMEGQWVEEDGKGGWKLRQGLEAEATTVDRTVA